MREAASTRVGGLALLAILIGAAGCGAGEPPEERSPARVAGPPGSARIELTPIAARRAGIRTVTVPSAAGGAVPASALVITARGVKVIFENPRRLTYMRTRVRLRRIAGGRAFLAGGPPAGTRVVVTGADELEGVARGVVPEE
jgi:hypothetical protein